MRGGGNVWATWIGLLLACACDRGATAETPSQPVEIREVHSGDAERRAAGERPDAQPRQEGLLIGEFRLAKNAVIDGDTIRVEGIDESLRMLSIDTEEKLDRKADRAAAAKDFDRYIERKRGNATRPQKAGTPMGEEAKRFAEAFFDGHEMVRLERDDPKEILGHYGRLLAYVFVKKDGRWTSYNVECVRAGTSPYFTKYGYSHRLHNELTDAEAEARQAKRGIWNPEARGYRDYEERKAWWNARADFIRAFEHEASRRDDYIELTHWDAFDQLEKRLGQEVTVLGTVGRIRHFKNLVRVALQGASGTTFPLIFFNKDAFQMSGIDRYKGEPVTVRGSVERYEKGDYRTLQIVVNAPTQLVLPLLPPPSNTARTAE
ncbi:MAG: thermonuclease family protein [Polyangiales bacterium]